MGGDNLNAPSKKQIKLADKIAYILDLEFPRGDFEFTAYDYWKFINEHISAYNRKLYESNFENNLDQDLWWGYDLGLWEF